MKGFWNSLFPSSGSATASQRRRFSLEELQYLHNVVLRSCWGASTSEGYDGERNRRVGYVQRPVRGDEGKRSLSDAEKEVVVEALRSIAELVIWYVYAVSLSSVMKLVSNEVCED